MLHPTQANIHKFEVVPSLPEPLKPLLDIAYNIWWTWHPEALELFLRLDRNLWHETKHNPVKMLGSCPQETLERFARDDGYLSTLERVRANLDRHLSRVPWLERAKIAPGEKFTIAYFCAEFGMAESLPIYSGGLGCLAGDHLKSASELGLPLVAVGLLYRNGYFQQYLSPDGWQQEYYPELEFQNLATKPVKGEDGKPVKVHVDLPGRRVTCQVWKTIVGRIELYLLDTNLRENEEADRAITKQLYGGDMDMRIRQEIVLGIGGVRALEAVGIKPDVFHMNEGHSAFLVLERVRKLIEEHDVSFDEARQQAAASNVFTTHTPVPAGIDRFPADLVTRYFKDYHESLRLDMEGLLALGREDMANRNEQFSMAVMAIRTADWANGVSALHGVVSRSMWQRIWPGVPESEIPITHVTNGCHARSWISGDLMYLFDRYLGSRWQDDPTDHRVWELVREIPDEEIWRVHERRKHRLIVWARRTLQKQLRNRGENPDNIRKAAEALTPDALTIGFARRFATYKRGTLMLRDADRILRIMADSDRPVQFIIAGKAHPADDSGKAYIRDLVQFARDNDVARHRLVFIENYDIGVARYLVQGCDVWLNTPRRGMEASGTSGMKGALNGVLNCSVLDGWWDEGYKPGIGWAIGRGETYAHSDVQDDLESRALYDLLENQVIPMFYERDQNQFPRRWIHWMKDCIATTGPFFNTNRMLQEYTEKLYLPAYYRGKALSADGLKGATELANQKHKLRVNWDRIAIEKVETDARGQIHVGDELHVKAMVDLGDLEPDDITVQLYNGPLDNDGRIRGGKPVEMTHVESLGDGKHHYKGTLSSDNSGSCGFAVRVVPAGEHLGNHVEPGLVVWDQPG